MLSIKLNAFLLAFMAIGCGQCLATYLKYEIGSEVCSNSEIQVKNEEAFNTSIILESSEMMPQSCAIRITTSSKVDGLMVTVHNLHISNSLNKSCDNNIEFGVSPIHQWCDSSDSNTLIFEKSSLDIVFTSNSNNSLSFNLVVTPFEKPVGGQHCVSSASFKCQTAVPLLCISEAFHCDGLYNCPNSTDEKDCSVTSKPEVIVQKPSLETQLPEIYSEKGYEKYNLADYCNQSVVHVIELKADSSAFLQLSEEDSHRLNESNCYLRFTSDQRLVIGIDNISIANNNDKTCDDFIQISDSSSDTIWCSNKTDTTGISFNQINDIDFIFHAGNDSNSSFSLVITPYKTPIFRMWCLSSSDLKCSSSGKQCVLKEFRCDGHNNCPKGEDEVGCHLASTTTPSPTTTKPTTTTPRTTTTTTSTTTTPHSTTTSKTTTTPTSKTTTTTETPEPAPTPHPMSPGMMALTVIGTLIGVFLIGLLGYICYRRRVANNVGYNALN